MEKKKLLLTTNLYLGDKKERGWKYVGLILLSVLPLAKILWQNLKGS